MVKNCDVVMKEAITSGGGVIHPASSCVESASDYASTRSLKVGLF